MLALCLWNCRYCAGLDPCLGCFPGNLYGVSKFVKSCFCLSELQGECMVRDIHNFCRSLLGFVKTTDLVEYMAHIGSN